MSLVIRSLALGLAALAVVLVLEAGGPPTAAQAQKIGTSVLETLRAAARTGVAVMASLHQVHLAVMHADRIIALRDGRVIADSPAAQVDGPAIEQIYSRDGGSGGAA
ncbi:MAG: hypothetical protein ABW020_01850 [Candidatus Rokuibacteriota bacterium]